ncbi:CPBP family intramembrane metalloprotease [Streptococcus macedonicus]|uniref:CAAX amino terminal protease family protein n=1 Tax=Streptococcus gallolyticus TaxID=315405 RepID=A0A380K5M2_9STRE|nr:CPBP family intramembrane glutamic endopeptidase [Streptococcus macedonicus]WGK80014.1 CPBP family intramembrane metalloprotease [Streptococcus macedonicus]SUN60372.1 CAAX amino terminal protease family protein [Streptococcus gallolyticus]
MTVGTVVFIAFIINSNFLQNISTEATVVDVSLRFLLSVNLAGVCYYFIKFEKLFNRSIKLSRMSKIWLTILILLFIAFLIVALNIGDNIQGVLSGGFGLFLPSLLVALLAGIFEEFLVRGLFFSGILNLFQNNRFKLILTSLISSAIFGLLHLVNIIHRPVQAVLQQVFYATVIGLVFAIDRITANSLWLPILIHALIDFQSTITSGTVDVNSCLTLIIIYLPLALFSIIILFR